MQRFKAFIRNEVIRKLRGQCGQPGRQFAVLLMENSANLYRLSMVKVERVNESRSSLSLVLSLFRDSDPLFDPSYTWYPHQLALTKNYIVAREERNDWLAVVTHPERILLERFHDLEVAYEYHYNKKVNCVLLYTWKMPCTQCVDEIINFFSSTECVNIGDIILVYSVDDIHSSQSRMRLGKHGVRVIKVHYTLLTEDLSVSNY